MESILNFLFAIWNYFVSLILPDFVEKGCPNGTDFSDLPSFIYFLNHLEPFQVVFLSIGTPISLITLALAFYQGYNVWKLISSEERRNNLYFLISLLPVSTFCCLIGMYSPRSAVLLYSIGLLYFLMCLFVLVSLIRHLAQGRKKLLECLIESGKKINFQGPPLCCCLFFLPKLMPTEENLCRLEWIVLQAPIVRVFILFGQVVAVAEERAKALKWLHFFDLASLTSLLLAIFGIHTLARLTSDQLSNYGFIGIFRLVDIALLFFSAQQPILFQNVLLRFEFIHCGPILSAQDSARFICNFVIVCEMFFISLGSTFLINPRRNNLFDKYHDSFATFLLNGDSSAVTSIISECSELGLETQMLDCCPTINHVSDISSTIRLTNENQSICTQMTLLNG